MYYTFSSINQPEDFVSISLHAFNERNHKNLVTFYLVLIAIVVM